MSDWRKEVRSSESILQKNRHSSKDGHWFGPKPEPMKASPECPCSGCEARYRPASVIPKKIYADIKVDLKKTSEFMDEDGEIRDYIQSMMKDSFDKIFMEKLYGPFIFGDGNFEVARDEKGRWQAYPCKGYYPRKPPTGIFNFDGIEKEKE